MTWETELLNLRVLYIEIQKMHKRDRKKDKE